MTEEAINEFVQCFIDISLLIILLATTSIVARFAWLGVSVWRKEMYGITTDCPVDLAKLTASIQAHEGLRLKPYTDSMGNMTIGYGRNLSGKGISNGEASDLLSSDISDAIAACESQGWWKNVVGVDARARAIIEICFNIGLGGLLTFTQAIAALSANDFDTAANQFLNSQWATQVGNRVQILAEMIRTGQDQPST